jgi:GDP-4-dehydro-6-deoxy-D-mannose reductase
MGIPIGFGADVTSSRDSRRASFSRTLSGCFRTTSVRVLITGAFGFAGTWLVRACRNAGDEVVAPSHAFSVTSPPTDTVSLDLRDAAATERVVREAQPDTIYHLAALSHVGRSWEDAAATLEVNVVGGANLLEAARKSAPQTRIVWVSSCEVYGRCTELPITESTAIAPRTPYGVSKAAGEMLAEVYAQTYGLPIVVARPFNHAGPGQRPDYLVSSLARQAAEARIAGAKRLTIVTGNPDTRRDFTDVRDVVRVYRQLAGTDVEPGVYNVSSGTSMSAADHIANIASLVAPLTVEHEVDHARFRADDVQDFRGSHDKLTAATAWQPEIPLKQTMADTIGWWETRLTETRQPRHG